MLLQRRNFQANSAVADTPVSYRKRGDGDGHVGEEVDLARL